MDVCVIYDILLMHAFGATLLAATTLPREYLGACTEICQ